MVKTANAAKKRHPIALESDPMIQHQPRKGRDVRRYTVYLSLDVAQRLTDECSKHNWPLSSVIEESLKKTLPRAATKKAKSR
jgi:hypothetical protein